MNNKDFEFRTKMARIIGFYEASVHTAMVKAKHGFDQKEIFKYLEETLKDGEKQWKAMYDKEENNAV